MNSTKNQAPWLLVALLLAIIVGIVVAWLSYDGSVKKAILRGLTAFGGTLVASIAIESQVGIV
jgi:hypothetical protein